MKRLVVYRNCFTGDISGGDMHMSGLLGWVCDARSATQAVLVRPRGDGQADVYPEVSRLKNISHPDTRLRQSIALMYVARAFIAASRVNKIVGDDDTLVASSHFLPDVLPVALARRPRAAKAVFIHHIIADMDRPPGLNTTLANWQERLCLALVRWRFGKVVVVNKDVAQRLRQLGFRRQHILLSSNFVSPQSRPRNYERKDITLLFCGRMVTQKGVDDFVTVCRRVAASTPNFRAVMLGVGPELKRLQDQVAGEGLPIELPGYVDDATKFDMLSRSKLFVFPSIEEGWGIVVAEALAVGTPVVAYDLPVYRAIFGVQPHVAPVKDVAGMARQTAELLQSYQDNPASYQLEQARIVDFAAQFQLARVAAREYDFLEAVS